MRLNLFLFINTVYVMTCHSHGSCDHYLLNYLLYYSYYIWCVDIDISKRVNRQDSENYWLVGSVTLPATKNPFSYLQSNALRLTKSVSWLVLSPAHLCNPDSRCGNPRGWKNNCQCCVLSLAQNEADYKDLLFNKMVLQTSRSWQAICMCIFVVKSRQCGLLINL